MAVCSQQEGLAVKFSERIEEATATTELQLRSMNEALRVGLWNAVDICFVKTLGWMFFGYEWPRCFYSGSSPERLWTDVFKQPLDMMPSGGRPGFFKWMRCWFMQAEWWEVYDLIEDFALNTCDDATQKKFVAACSAVLRREQAGYRFEDNRLVPLTTETDLLAIRDAREAAARAGQLGVLEHLSNAFAKLSNRTDPDYRNSIKESILAVEGVCQVIAGEKATLGDALKIVAEKVGLHPALQKGMSSIYGYTNNHPGIRHAMLEDGESRCSYADAKYMHVICSAFVDYLNAKAESKELMEADYGPS
jgi:hypothetical protein